MNLGVLLLGVLEGRFKFNAEYGIDMMDSETWKFVKDYCDAYKPVYHLILATQHQATTHSDVFLHSNSTIKKLSKLGSSLAEQLKSCLEKRFKHLQTDLFWATLFVSPYGHQLLQNPELALERRIAVERLQLLTDKVYPRPLPTASVPEQQQQTDNNRTISDSSDDELAAAAAQSSLR